jgi:WD40 repeat protein
MFRLSRRQFVTAGLTVTFGYPLRHVLAQDQAPSASSPDGKFVARGVDKVVSIFDAATRKEVLRFAGHTDRVSALAFSPDGKLLASGSLDKSVRLWDVAIGREIRVLRIEVGIDSVAFSADGRKLTLRGTDKKPRVFDLATGKQEG